MADQDTDLGRVGKNRSVPVMDVDQDRFQVVDLSGEVFLLDEGTGNSYQIGVHGRRVWGLLVGGASVEEAASTLALETGSDAAVVLQDTRRLVADLIDVGVIAEVRI